jgi:RNA polymerase sigma-70 factor (ECF subfamily)
VKELRIGEWDSHCREQVKKALDDEKRLISKIQKHGDRSAANALVEKYYDEICVYAYRQTSDKNTAMDLTQDIFIAMLKTITKYDGKKAGFRTWLYKIATNKIIDHHRSNSIVKAKTLDLEDIEIPDEIEFTKKVEDKDLASQIDAHVGRFDIDAQRIFRLKVYSEHTFTEIASMTDIPESTVKTKFYRMLKALREEFGNESNT